MCLGVEYSGLVFSNAWCALPYMFSFFKRKFHLLVGTIILMLYLLGQVSIFLHLFYFVLTWFGLVCGTRVLTQGFVLA
jgi:hypothetical protein